MWLPRLRDDEQLLLRDKQRVKAPSSDEQLAGVLRINTVSVSRGDLHQGAR
jgi:hypothetical protein